MRSPEAPLLPMGGPAHLLPISPSQGLWVSMSQGWNLDKRSHLPCMAELEGPGGAEERCGPGQWPVLRVKGSMEMESHSQALRDTGVASCGLSPVS